jgi:hypothetical protein
MSQFSKWKTIGYAAAIFVTGGISGGALGVYEAKSHLFEPQREQEIAVRIRTRLQTKLALSPDQMAKINPIIDSDAAAVRAIHMEATQRVNKVFEDSYAKVSYILTPEQRAELDQMEKERREMMEAHWQENHHHPSPSGSASPDHDEHSPEPSPAAP